jgi:hypothetical protein
VSWAASWRLPAILLLLLPACAGTARAAETTPRFLVYYNADVTPARALAELPYTHVVLAFLTPRVAADGTVSVATDPRIVAALQAAGKRVLVSFGGGDAKMADYKPLVGRETELAKAIAGFVRLHGLDGVDIDFEVSETLETQPPAAAFDGRAVLIALTRALRRELGAAALLSHAPEPPFLDPAWHGGPYLEVLKAAGTAIDWIVVQYYNNAGFDDPLAVRDGKPAPGSYAAVAAGQPDVPWSPAKTLLGKPIYKADAENGHVAPRRLRDHLVAPLVTRYGKRFGGLAGWQFSTHTADHRFWNREMAPALGLD